MDATTDGPRVFPSTDTSAMQEGTMEARVASTQRTVGALLSRIRDVWARDPWRIAGLPLVLVVMCVYFTTQSPYFLTSGNIQNIALNMSTVGILAVGEAFVIVLAEIDISVGAILGLTSVTTAIGFQHYGPVAGVVAGLLTGVVAGSVNGFVVSRFRVHSVIVTIGTMTAIQGLGFAVTNGTPVVVTFPSWVTWLGNGSIGSVPAPFVIMVGVILFGGIVFRLTTFGPKLFATGGNEEAARLAGINVTRVKLIAFVVAGLLASVAGVVYASRISSGQPTLGQGLELQAIAAAVVGGMALTGGRGTIVGVFLGVLILTILQDGLDITNVNSFWKTFVTGVVIVLAVIVDSLRTIGVRSVFGRQKRLRTGTADDADSGSS
jgi:ribose/xylose/arabinose/galactoside ABC-type transport system permease subunit